MAVFTALTFDEVETFAAAFPVGAVRSLHGIVEGCENSNFLLVTETGRYILTLYEKRTRIEDLPFFLGLMEHLARHGVPCPLPLVAREGWKLGRLADRPAALVTFLEGAWPREVTPAHCTAFGAALARLHLAGEGFPMKRGNDFGPAAWTGLAAAMASEAERIRPGLGSDITSEAAFLARRWPVGLPEGVIHGDLFPDNVFFGESGVSGIIDFYFACNDALALDIAICLNAWCFAADGRFAAARASGLLAGYESVRPLIPAEHQALPVLARGAALRFLLTRLQDRLHPARGPLVAPKDPLEYFRILRFHRTSGAARGYGSD